MGISRGAFSAPSPRGPDRRRQPTARTRRKFPQETTRLRQRNHGTGFRQLVEVFLRTVVGFLPSNRIRRPTAARLREGEKRHGHRAYDRCNGTRLRPQRGRIRPDLGGQRLHAARRAASGAGIRRHRRGPRRGVVACGRLHAIPPSRRRTGRLRRFPGARPGRHRGRLDNLDGAAGNPTCAEVVHGTYGGHRTAAERTESR